jgi:4-methyl-5(b-hydroxyethyl)-thiazole monophosphate biosynthesis
MVKKHVEKGKLYAAVCAAPAVALGAWGLLNGLKVILSPVIHFLYALYYRLSFG